MRHDSVKRTIERLADKAVIELPPLVEYSTTNHQWWVYPKLDAPKSGDIYPAGERLGDFYCNAGKDHWWNSHRLWKLAPMAVRPLLPVTPISAGSLPSLCLPACWPWLA
jgi:hypothetical protein